MQPILLAQRIITPERVWEFPVFFEPQVWWRGNHPTCVILEGEVPQDILEGLVYYAELHGWRWDPKLRRFYPMDTE